MVDWMIADEAGIGAVCESAVALCLKSCQLGSQNRCYVLKGIRVVVDLGQIIWSVADSQIAALNRVCCIKSSVQSSRGTTFPIGKLW